jgi:hypothetical protein
MKTHILNRNYSYILVLMLLTSVACVDLNPKSDDTKATATYDKNVPKAVLELILEDNGAVVPMPKSRRLVLRFKNKEDILLTYSENTGNEKEGTKDEITINENERETMRDEIDKIVEYAEDGMDIKAGKQPCVGMNSLNVAVVYNTGDTTRFAVTGSARCDPSLYPSVWAVDSMATEHYRVHKGKGL